MKELLTPIRRIRVTPRLRYIVALARRGRQLSAEHGNDIVFDLPMSQLGSEVLRQLERQEVSRAKRLAQMPRRTQMVGVVEVQLRRKRPA